MGRWHCHFAKSLGATIDAVVDADEVRARELATSAGCANVYRHVDQLLNRSPAQIIHVCTPTQTHASLIESCLGSRRHVLVEKPLAMSRETCERLLALAQKSGVVLNVVHQFVYQRGFVELLERQNRLGEVTRVSFLTCSAGGDNKSAAERRQILLEILPHPAALFQNLFGETFAPQNFSVQKFSDDELELTGSIANAYATVSISLRGRPTRNEFNVIATQGSAHLDLFHGYAVFESGAVSRAQKVLKPFRFGTGMVIKATSNLARRAVAQESAYPGLRECIEHFYEAVAIKQAAPISEIEIIKAAELIERAKRG
jgi:predicted dehydrogenase